MCVSCHLCVICEYSCYFWIVLCISCIYLYISCVIPVYTAEMENFQKSKKNNNSVVHIRMMRHKILATFCGASTDMRHRIWCKILWRMSADAPQNCLTFCGACARMHHRIPKFCGAPRDAPQKSNTSRVATVATWICATESKFGAPQLAYFPLVMFMHVIMLLLLFGVNLVIAKS